MAKRKPPFADEIQRAVTAYSRRDWIEAERLCRQVLDAKADHFDALTLLGIVTAQMGRMQEAAELFGRAVAANPNDAVTHLKHGNALEELKRLDEALVSYEKAIKLKPDYAEAHSNRGTVLQELKRLDEALASYEQAIKLEPGHAGTCYNRGSVLQLLGRLDEAAASYAQAIELEPAFASAYNNRGNALKELGRVTEALASFKQAITLQPDHAEAYSNLGNALEELQRPDEALASYEQAMRLEPRLEYLQGAWLHAKSMLCDWTGFDIRTGELLARVENGEKATLPFPVLMLTSALSVQRRAAEIWANDKCPASAALPKRARRDKAEKIRIGYFSPDFRDHPVAFLTAELFETHDRSRFELTAFSFGPNTGDDMRKRMETAFDRFVDVRAFSAKDTALMSRKLEIDIAVDLAGFTHNSRPEIFAMRAAPLQVGFLGYPGTMGVDYIDYLIADRTVIPETSRQHYAEKIAYLPRSFQVNDSRRAMADRKLSREELGLPRTGFVFCCFNNSGKITPGTFDCWMRILKQVEGSVLWLSEGSRAAAGNLRKEAEARGVRGERLVFAGRMPLLAEHLARYRAADLFLDTLPYNAHATASDALWAGLPVLTCMGEAFAGRVAASLLNAIDLPELVTTTPELYETLAVGLAADSSRLAQCREKLRGNRLTTPLFDTRLFARHIEAAYTQMHERHHAGLAPAHIFVN